MSAITGAEAQIRQWVDEVVVGLNLCPFAKRELSAGRVRIVSEASGAMEPALEVLADEAITLLNADSAATTLVVFPSGFESFDDYLDLLDMSQALLEQCGWDDALQLASFHPDYCFEGVEPDDAANYTNRAPLPVIHLLRQDDVAVAIEKYGDVDVIPPRNEKLAREKGAAFFEDVLKRCRAH